MGELDYVGKPSQSRQQLAEVGRVERLALQRRTRTRDVLPDEFGFITHDLRAALLRAAS